MDLCIYEDASVANLSPLSLTRPVFDLRCGIFNLKEKVVRRFPGSRVHYLVRPELRNLLKERNEHIHINTLPTQDAFFINGRVILDQDLALPSNESTVFIINGRPGAAFVTEQDLQKIKYEASGLLKEKAFKSFPQKEINGKWIDYPWDILHHCAEEIEDDFEFLQCGGRILGKVYLNVTILNKNRIYLAPGAQLQPGVVLNAEEGPIYIGEGAKIMSNAVIMGPVAIGRNSVVKAGAKIYEGTSIGEMCKVGGEIEESILHGFANKQHEGFLGHAYLGEWVNLGADTNNSDLKNNYGTVRVFINGEMVDSESMFVGLFMGDHSKAGINTMFTTGAVVGVMSNVFGAGFTPKYIPSFSWGGIENTKTHDFEKALETAEVVMNRRKKELTFAQRELYELIYEKSKTERK